MVADDGASAIHPENLTHCKYTFGKSSIKDLSLMFPQCLQTLFLGNNTISFRNDLFSLPICDEWWLTGL